MVFEIVGQGKTKRPTYKVELLSSINEKRIVLRIDRKDVVTLWDDGSLFVNGWRVDYPDRTGNEKAGEIASWKDALNEEE